MSGALDRNFMLKGNVVKKISKSGVSSKFSDHWYGEPPPYGLVVPSLKQTQKTQYFP
jgi:hypothetical protein